MTVRLAAHDVNLNKCVIRQQLKLYSRLVYAIVYGYDVLRANCRHCCNSGTLIKPAGNYAGSVEVPVACRSAACKSVVIRGIDKKLTLGYITTTAEGPRDAPCHAFKTV